MSKAWFEVDRAGLAALQAGKPKWFVFRELVANAFDEAPSSGVLNVEVELHAERGFITGQVRDDSPEGFKDLLDAFTMYRHTVKRLDRGLRGRFNFGEKQAISQCASAVIETTTGTVTFDRNGRTQSRKCTKKGSRVTVCLRGSLDEVGEIIGVLRTFKPPLNVAYTVQAQVVPYVKPVRFFDTELQTEVLKDDVLRRVTMSTRVYLYALKSGEQAWLYELGIPVCEIDCKYGVDVLQKVPLGPDRETVPARFLRELYAEVLNHTHEDLVSEESSEAWVRLGAQDERVSRVALDSVIVKRYGEKVVVANPGDPIANDDALSNGYRVVHGSEMSRDEWARVRDAGLVQSSTAVFGRPTGDARSYVNVTPGMLRVSGFAKRVAAEAGIRDLRVDFVSMFGGKSAWYGGRALTFNVASLGKAWFDGLGEVPPSRAWVHVVDLVIHELAHEKGHHTEVAYLNAVSRLGAELARKALIEPEWFRVID